MMPFGQKQNKTYFSDISDNIAVNQKYEFNVNKDLFCFTKFI